MSSPSTTLQFLFSSIANVECYDSSYSMLGHDNFNTIKKIMHLNLIPKLHINRKRKKCKIYAQARNNLERFLI